MSTTHPTASVRNGMCDHVVDQLDGGDIQLWDSAETTLLATLTFMSPAFGNAGASVEGQAAANAIGSDSSADATGDAAYAYLRNSGGTVIARCSVSGSGGAGDLKLTTASATITAGQTVSCSSLTYTTSP